MFKKPAIYRGLACLFAFLLIILALVATMLEQNRVMVDRTLGTQSQILVSDDNGSLYTAYTPDEAYLTDGKLDMTKNIAIHRDIGTRIAEEGAVLLKNNGALPLAAGNKVTLLGYHAYRNNIPDGLTAAGLVVNPTVKDLYTSLNVTEMSPGWAYNKVQDGAFQYDPNEPSRSQLAAKNATYLNSFSEYNNAAIVVLGRYGAEGGDYMPGESGVAAGVGARTPLALSNNEKDIVDLACEHFNKVIVLIYTVNVMEIGYLENKAEVDAVMYIGILGDHGAYGLGNLLVGKANPSGGLYDIYPSNTLSAPAMRNFGHYVFSNASEITRTYATDTSTFNAAAADSGLINYVIEAESIYVGYRYYETRYYDTVLNQGHATTLTDATGVYEDSVGSWSYSSEVVYGFGYGLSYTEFSYKIDEVVFDKSEHGQIAHVTVTVTNEGNVDGKTSVQIYGRAPYTSYDIAKGVEKSAIQLLAFEKTDVIESHDFVTLTVDVDLQDLASYDAKGAGTYIMETLDGYYFAVGNGAHDALNNLLADEGYTTADGMDYDGDAQAAYKWEYAPHTSAVAHVEDGIDAYTFSVSKNGTKIENSLKFSDWSDYEEGVVTTLTRSDWSGTFPKTYSSLTAPSSLISHFNGNYIDVKTSSNPDSAEALAEVKFKQSTDLKFASLAGADYDDPRWTELIDSLTLEETINFAIKSGRGFEGLDSINFPEGSYVENTAQLPVWYSDANAQNAPWAITRPSSFLVGAMPNFSLFACTFNPELIYEYGNMIGHDALFSEIPMLWLLGINLHRTAYNGRNFQYFSEDPVLTGVLAMEAVAGAAEAGTVLTIKHLAFNDQEMHRSGIGTFMTEQRARELELRAFQIPVESNKYDTEEKDAGASAIMTSFTKLGGIECTSHKGLLTDILSGEWGYRGYISSDLKDDLNLMTQAFKAGMGGYDWRDDFDVTTYNAATNFQYDAELLKAIKEVAHRKLYVLANSNLMNRVNTTTKSVWNMTWWRSAYIAGIVITSVLTAAGFGLYVASLILNKKKESN